MKKLLVAALSIMIGLSFLSLLAGCSFEAGTKTDDVYSITYVLAGGTVSEENPKDYTENTDTFTLNTPVKDGYDFLGWLYDGVDTPQPEVTIEKGSTGDKRFVATYSLHEYNINYVLGEGEVENSHNPTAFTLESDDLKIRKPVRMGYEFLGWTFEGQNEPTSKVVIKNGTKGDITLTAHFTEWAEFTNEAPGKDFDNEFTKSGLFEATKKDILVFDYKLVTPAENPEDSEYAFMIFNEATDLNWEKYVGYIRFNPYTNESSHDCVTITEKGDGWYTLRLNMWNAPISGAVTRDYLLTDFYLRGAWTNSIVTLDNFSVETQEIIELPEGFSDLDVAKAGSWGEYSFKDFTIAKRDDLTFDVFFTKSGTAKLRLYIDWKESTQEIVFNVEDETKNSEGVTVELKEGTTNIYTVTIDVEKAILADGANIKTEFEMIRFPDSNEADFYIANVTKIAGEPLPEEDDIVDVVVPAEFEGAAHIVPGGWREYMFDGFTVTANDDISFDVFVTNESTVTLRVYLGWTESTDKIYFNVEDDTQNSEGVSVVLKEGTTNAYTVTIDMSKANLIDGATATTAFDCIRFPDSNAADFYIINVAKVGA